VPANLEPVVSLSSSTRTASPASSYDNISSCIVSSIDPLGNHFHVNVIIKGINRSIRSPAMIDSGATALFISKRFVQRHYIICSPLPNTIALHNIDGSKNKAGSLTHFACLTLTIGSWNEPTDFFVTDLGPEDIILGLPWLKKVNPTIDWDSGEMEIPNSPEQFTPSSPHLVEANRSERRAWIKAGIITDASDEIWVCAGYTLSTELAMKAGEGKVKKTFEELVPKEYQCHAKVFSETELHRLPKHQSWDHMIDLKSDALETLKTKVYPMPINEQKTTSSLPSLQWPRPSSLSKRRPVILDLSRTIGSSTA
jgi:hypothetical protein